MRTGTTSLLSEYRSLSGEGRFLHIPPRSVSKPEGGRRFEHLSLCFVTVRMCVFVCTNMTSLLTYWRLLLAIVVAQGGDDD